jgi:hypothetical protein
MNDYEYWEEIYKVELRQLYLIFLENLFKHKIELTKSNYNEFCYLIYKQSSGKINNYDKETYNERNFH